jgi:hypothetical protein
MSADTTGILQLASNNGTVALTISTAQNVGIGTTSPNQKFRVENNANSSTWINSANSSSGGGAGSGVLFTTDQGDAGAIFQNSSGNTAGTGANSLRIRNLLDAPIGFETNGSERVRITNGGSFVIAGTVATRLLTLGNGTQIGASISVYDPNGGIYFGTGGSGGGGFNVNPAIARAQSVGFHVSGSAVGDLCIGGEQGLGIRFGTSNVPGGSNNRMYIAADGVVSVAGNLSVAGALSKGSGSFRIEHPLPQLAETHQLVHSFIEGPQADLIYRGKINLVDGFATVDIDASSSMTEGTFVALCRDVQCFTTNESDWTAVRGSVIGNLLKIEAEDSASTASISWMVIGERQDKHMYDTDWTDINGKVIVEPLKPVEQTQTEAPEGAE